MLQDKVVVISGGLGYLGFAVAEAFVNEGARVALIYKTTDPEIVSTKMESLGNQGHKAYACNLSHDQEVSKLFEAILKDFGTVDICVHAASQKPVRKKISHSTEAEVLEQFEGTILSGFNFLIAASRVVKEKGGVIVGITTAGVVNKNAVTSMGAYIPAKYAVQGILIMLKEELKGKGVEVYSVAPGFMEGGMNNDIPKAFVEILKSKTKNKTLLTKEDVASTIIDICQNQEKYKNIETVLLSPEYE